MLLGYLIMRALMNLVRVSGASPTGPVMPMRGF